MSRGPIPIPPALYDYLLAVSAREHQALAELRAEIESHPRSSMQISADEGALLGLLVQAIGARRAIEIGVFTGYSSLCVALAMPPEGRIVACDVSDEFTRVARRYWEKAGVAHKIDLQLRPAAETLDALLAAGQAESFDFAFIDADKLGYDGYYERTLRLLRRGGLIAIDNVLWSGKVADPSVQDEETRAMRALNAKLHADDRITLAMLTVADGLTLALKR